ncbi:putative nucleolar protein 9 [Apostichopus japonicus]|uniref:Putative nucleolar protein 9 n=1 Tax=Stichopus japonicus TaxID=307972 RepID=A0A2G8JMB1_STIJA|nr:putative nucleolar protein 9 [Apostichopus japonicus]
MAARMEEHKGDKGNDSSFNCEDAGLLHDSGRKGRVEHHVLGYYRRVHEALQDGFQETHEQEMFLENVFKQTEEQEVKLCQNQTISRILEEILPLGKSSQLLTFFKGLLSDSETIMYDRFGAHVLQTTMTLSLEFAAKQDEADAFNALLLNLSQSVRDQLESVVTDTYASHVLRTLLQVFGGLQVAEKVTRSKLSREQQQRDLIQETRVILENRPETYQNEFLLLQSELMKSKQLEVTVKKSKKKIQWALTLPDAVVNPISSHLIETIIDVASDDILKDLTETCFNGLLLKLAKTPVANFILQRIISKTVQSESMDQIMTELTKGFHKILAANNTGVLLQLAETCFLFPAHQETFVKSLLEALKGFTPEERQLKAIILIGSLQSFEVLFPSEDDENSNSGTGEVKPKGIEVKLHGSLLLQSLLKFQNKRIVVNGFMALSTEELKTIICQPAGSYLLEHFMSNERIKDKKKEQLINTMKNDLFSICCDKSGSRAMESVFKMSSIKMKTIIAEVLAKKETQLHSDRFGCFVHRTCQLSQFKHRRNAWTSIMTKDDKKRKLFADLIGEAPKDTNRTLGNRKKQKNSSHHEGPS